MTSRNCAINEHREFRVQVGTATSLRNIRNRGGNKPEQVCVRTSIERAAANRGNCYILDSFLS
jgi:hypothetical protein